MKLQQSLEQQGYMAIKLENHDDLNAAVREAADAWKAFCKLPEDQKQRFPYSDDLLVGSGVGYELKKGGGGFDVKEVFHARAKSRDSLMHDARKVGPLATMFVASALNVSAQLLPVVKEFAELSERAYGMAGFRKNTVEALSLWTIRFLHYFPTGNPEAILASQHTDKGCFTPHLYESDAGLERLTFDPDPTKRVWTPMPVNHEETVIFPGLRLQLRSENRLKATCHRVVSNERTAKAGRYSAVAFIDTLGVPYYNKKDVGRTQNFGPGFNYDMPFENYRELFREAEPAL